MKAVATDFWNKHSRQYLEMALKHEPREMPDELDGYGQRTGDCGDTVEIFLTIKDNKILQAGFRAQGCMNTNACCNTLVHLIEGLSVEDAWQTTPEDVADYLETLPSDHFHCAELTIGALYLALNNYQERRKAL